MSENISRKHPLLKHLLLMLVVSVAIVAIAFLFIKLFARQGQEYELADFRGEMLEQVSQDNPLKLNFVVIDSIYDADSKGGVVLQQDPKPGTMVKTKRTVYVTVTAHAPSDVVLPELSNMTVRSAVSALDAAGLRCGTLKFVDSPYRNVILEATYKGRLISAGEKMEQGSAVDLTVGLGEGNPSTIVPFVIGQVPAKVHRAILSASLNVGREHYDNSVTNRSSAVCYRLEPDYTGVTRYPLGTYVELWYCNASDKDVERIISTFKVDSSKIVLPEAETEEDVAGSTYVDEWDWDW
ncbi:MAG: PASTA domain-containing protein [Bacteroidales bacterium]|nr:PASTA domain-containing protein [Bacteroidales bacterium]